jgi:hypothetical protein
MQKSFGITPQFLWNHEQAAATLPSRKEFLTGHIKTQWGKL